tara:strand:- start:352 stop:486 length:135 start_codon:yes stop_codon:yes gene_type:complete
LEASLEVLYYAQALVDKVIVHIVVVGFIEAGRHNVRVGPDGQPI